MATIYLSYKSQDRHLAEELRQALARRGHETRSDLDDLAGGDDWRKVLTEALQSSDVLVALLTESALFSQFVAAEIGSARIIEPTTGIKVIPVVAAGMEIPPLVKDLNVIWLRDSDPTAVEEVAASIDQAVATHLKRQRGQYPRIFISHRHKDVELVKALVRLLETAFKVEPTDLRCTSVPPYKLKAGDRTGDRLRTEIRRAKAVLGILTPDTKASSYVLFELGASWGQAVLTFPLLAGGATSVDIPSPIGDLHQLNLSDENDCFQLIDNLADVSGLERRAGSGSAIAEQIRRVVSLAGAAAGGAGRSGQE